MKKRIISAVILLSVGAAIGYAAAPVDRVGSKAGSNGSGAGYAYQDGAGDSTGTAATKLEEQRRQEFDNWAAHQQKFSTSASAQQALAFTLRLPSHTATPTVIYVTSNENKAERTAYAVLGEDLDGLHLVATPSPSKPPFAEQVRSAADGHTAGTNKADRVAVLTEVHGVEAIANEPGYNQIDGQKMPRPGYLVWWDNGVLYELYGTKGAGGNSLPDLKALAESMY